MKKRSRRPKLTAKTADLHALYQEAVQGPEVDCRLFDRFYRQKNGRYPHFLREDFCGTAYLCATWVAKRRKNRALGIDLDAPTLAWGMEHNILPLGDAADRVELRNKNVLSVTRPLVDVCCALNFSYWVFETRVDLKRYFRVARRSLAPGGILVLDVFGGADAQLEDDERRQQKGFVYVWRQEHFDPVTNHLTYHIDFEFKDGSKIRPAYTYDWRLWSIPELRELLAEAGFESTDVYWEGTERGTNEGNGVYRKVEKGDADNCWVSYIVAHP